MQAKSFSEKLILSTGQLIFSEDDFGWFENKIRIKRTAFILIISVNVKGQQLCSFQFSVWLYPILNEYHVISMYLENL